MKKVILSVLVVGALLATSCKKEKEATKDAAKDVVEAADKAVDATKDAATKVVTDAEAAVDKAVDAVKSAIEGVTIPEFKDPKVGEYLQTYSTYAKDYIEAKGDVLKNAELAKKGVELAAKGKEIVSTLDAEGVKKFNSVMSALQSKMAPAK
ncbi:hypothetical protein H3Z83_07390 [Tenacibaculum sp. S7007]|uniref:Lipoprotein n=1 Tax=Tenacibaculum pelagium TaxID=2759527 RepID=A0A839AMM4_9FLAO|nr:hypothetical protein [Tenacibaculum pelagium]MBA6156335.1 hypothetical protein [Tenacibaculum pelagium]